MEGLCLDPHVPEGRTQLHEIALHPLRAIRVEVVQGPDLGKRARSESHLITVGSSPDNSLQLSDETVSRYHLELRHRGDRVEAVDLGSTNGTVHGKAYLSRASLIPGALLQLGKTTLRIDDGDPLPVEIYDDEALHGLRGRSTGMRTLMARIEKAAASGVSALLLGETGVGKELVAEAIHRSSARASGPFERVDCGALAPTLIASELFGHERGAFTGADRRYIGAFERADKGTLFLDEIGELPMSLQIALLGALERRSFRRVGGDKPIAVDLRLVSATNRDLRAEVNAGTFREDLYYRLAVVRLDIPALRERIQDIPLLIEHFLRQAGYQGPLDAVIPKKVMDTLLEYRWPGNVRELRNFAEAALAMGEAPLLGEAKPAEYSQKSIFPSVPVDQLILRKFKDARSLVLDELESLYLRELLQRTGDNISRAAREAEIHRTYLIEMLKRHGLR